MIVQFLGLLGIAVAAACSSKVETHEKSAYENNEEGAGGAGGGSLGGEGGKSGAGGFLPSPLSCNPQTALSNELVSIASLDAKGNPIPISTDPQSTCAGISSNFYGKKVVFECDDNTGFRNIYFRNLEEMTAQLIIPSSKRCLYPQIAPFEDKILVQCNQDPFDWKKSEIHLYDHSTQQPLNLTQGVFPSFAMDGSGGYQLAFVKNNSLGIPSVWLARIKNDKDPTYQSIPLEYEIPILDSLLGHAPNGFSIFPRLSSDGKHVVFLSNADLIPGQEAEGRVHSYLLSLDTNQLMKMDQKGLIFSSSDGDPNVNAYWHFRPLFNEGAKTITYWEADDVSCSFAKAYLYFIETGKSEPVDLESACPINQGEPNPTANLQTGFLVYVKNVELGNIENPGYTDIINAKSLMDGNDTQLSPPGLLQIVYGIALSGDGRTLFWSGSTKDSPDTPLPLPFNIYRYSGICTN